MTTTPLIFASLAILVACDDPGSGGNAADVDAIDEVGTTDAQRDVAPALSVSGRIGAVDFVGRDALFRAHDDETYLVLTDHVGACADFSDKLSAAGISQVQLWLPGVATPTTYAQVDAMAATVASDCPSGAPIDESRLAYIGRSDSATVTLTRVSSDLIEGTLTIVFDDGSSLQGAFAAASCEGPQEGDGASCR